MFLVRDAFNMIRQITDQGLVIGLWGALLNIPQFIGGIAFIDSIEGKVVLVLSIGTLMVAGQMHRHKPFSRLIGLCHLPWLVMLPWLVFRLAGHDYSPLHGYWIHYVVGVVAISLIFDTADIVRYIRGDKSFSWVK